MRWATVLLAVAAASFLGYNELPETGEAAAGPLAEAHADLKSIHLERLLSPVRMTPGRPGRLFLTDHLAQAVVELENRGGEPAIVRALAVPGAPLGVAWARNLLFVGNASTQSVDVYLAATGRWLYSLGGQGAIADPKDIAVDPRMGLVFVLDGQAGVVKVFRLGGRELLYTVSGHGTAQYDLQNPTAIALDPVRQELLVSDYGDPRLRWLPPSVKIFSYEGAPLSIISGRLGMFGQRFSRPQGLTVAGEGRILMAEAVAGEVQVLDRHSGALLGTIGGWGRDTGQLRLPLDVLVDRHQRAIVLSNGNRRLEVFDLGGYAQ
jgi:sugar lactone lactonase YvrE